MFLMKLKIMARELTVHRLIIVSFSLVLLLLVNLLFSRTDSPSDKVPYISEEKMEQIEIIELPFVSSVQDKIFTVEAVLLSGSNLNDLLLSQGLSRDEASSVVFEISPFVDLRRMRAGEIFTLEFINDDFERLSMNASQNMIVEVFRDNSVENGFRASEKERQLNHFVKHVSGTIEESLYNSALAAGMSANILTELIHLLSFDVDFQRDIQEGDSFEIAFEEIYDEKGEKVEDGQILFAKMITDGRVIEFYHYTDLEGKSDYFNIEGQTIRKTLLKTPINGAYITSGYGMRISPITGFSKRHQGIDFGAPSGTPIYASGDGVIESAYYSQVYGNFIEIRHVNGYRTLYGHMTNYARGMRKGIRVSQGQIIGYVGSTGMSTGPHLHYEISYWRTKLNPSTVKSPPGRSLKGEDLVLFENLKKSYIASFLQKI